MPAEGLVPPRYPSSLCVDEGRPRHSSEEKGRTQLHPQDECMQLGLAAQVGVCGCGEGSLQVESFYLRLERLADIHLM